MRTVFAFLFSLLGFVSMPASASSLHDFTLTDIAGKPMPLAQFKGKAVLLVNTASECGYTPQYEGLERLWARYADRGLVVIGVPSNDFGGQEPGKAEEIASFCKLNYGVTFPLADKAVVSGQNALPVYQWVGEQAGLLGRPKWNFHKYLFGKDGRFIEWYSTATEPESNKIIAAIERELKE